MDPFTTNLTTAPHLVVYSINNQIFRIPSRYEIKKVVGTGSYGIVVSAYDSITKTTVAIKKNIRIFERDDQDGFLSKRILREVKLMEHFRDLDNIITLRDLIPPVTFDLFEDVYIVMDLMEKDLRTVLKSKSKFDLKTVKYFMYALCKGLKIIHSANVVHRDIKPSNILINRKLDVVFCDFGLAREINVNPKIDEVTMSTPYVVTRWYRSPELLMMYEKAGPSLDIWSIGLVFFELLQDFPRVPVFQGKNHLDQLNLIIEILGTPDEKDVFACQSAKDYLSTLSWKPQTLLKDHPLMPPDTDPSALDLLSKMLHFNPEKRISAVDALAHPYFGDFHDEEDEPSTNIYHGGDESIPDNKEAVRRVMYDEIMQWNEKMNNIKGDATIDEVIIYL